MAATNRPDILDPALLRPGRFDRRVVMDPPDLKGRRGILEVHVRGKPLASDVELEALAKDTPGFVGADIENMVNEAAILAARRNKKRIGMAEFEEAVEKVLMGPERKSRLLSPEDKRITAYHEGGHAVVGRSLPNCDPVRKLTIIPRGMSLGLTATRPDGDRYIRTRSKFMDDMSFMLGGRAAEELIFEDISTGAQNDMERATQLARQMVTRFGMSEKLGPMVWGQKEELVFLGREIGEQRDYSEKVAQEIDEEVRLLIRSSYDKAKEILLANRERLIAIAEALIEKETLDEKEFESFFHPEPSAAA
jgi:cell division protease FtsH